MSRTERLNFYETPAEVAERLVRHLPKHLATVLDPSVGHGSLLAALPEKVRFELERIVAIDVSPRAIEQFKEQCATIFNGNLESVRTDFLGWAVKAFGSNVPPLFDCVLMNPPFAAKKVHYRSLKKIKRALRVDFIPDYGPIEAAFVVSALNLLRHGGRLLAVLPSSLMVSSQSNWIREYMHEFGAFHYVHELPRFAFPKIESRMYLVVFERGKRKEKIPLLNHDLHFPEKMAVSTAEVRQFSRLDFQFYSSKVQIEQMRSKADLQWVELSELAELARGKVQTPSKGTGFLHTGDYSDGFWRRDVIARSDNAKIIRDLVVHGDLVVKRVSRSCASSFGYACRAQLPFSDCLIRVRPKAKISSIRLLFAIRTLMNFGPSRALLEKGTGASYLSVHDLSKLLVPSALWKTYPVQFRQYQKAVKSGNSKLMQSVESETLSLILG